jgi:hypothetical protein
MEDKRGTKRPHFPFADGSSSPNDAKTPPPVPSGSPPPPGSMSEITSRHPRSPVFEQGGPSGNIPVIELSSSSDEEDFFTDTSWDAEFTRRLFGDLNLLGPPSDDKVIVLSDSDEEEEAREETAAGADVASSTTLKYSTPAPSIADADEDPGKMQDDNSDDIAPGQDTGKSSGSGDKDGLR